jgi:hypothetical protein
MEAPRTKTPECFPQLLTYCIPQHNLKMFKYVFAPGWSASTDTYHLSAEKPILFMYSK